MKRECHAVLAKKRKKKKFNISEKRFASTFKVIDVLSNEPHAS
jgi:hypothetical protein